MVRCQCISLSVRKRIRCRYVFIAIERRLGMTVTGYSLERGTAHLQA